MNLIPHLGGGCDAGVGWSGVSRSGRDCWHPAVCHLPCILYPGSTGVAEPALYSAGVRGFMGYQISITPSEYHDSLRNGPHRRLTGTLKFAVSNAQMITKPGSENQTIEGPFT